MIVFVHSFGTFYAAQNMLFVVRNHRLLGAHHSQRWPHSLNGSSQSAIHGGSNRSLNGRNHRHPRAFHLLPQSAQAPNQSPNLSQLRATLPGLAHLPGHRPSRLGLPAPQSARLRPPIGEPRGWFRHHFPSFPGHSQHRDVLLAGRK